MPRPVPTTLRLRSSRSSPRGQPVPHVPNRPLRFPRSTPPPEPSARPSGFSVRSQRDSLGLNPQMINGSRSYPRCREVQSRRATHSLSQAPPVCQKYRRGGVPAAPDVWVFGCSNSPALHPTTPYSLNPTPYAKIETEFHKYAWHTCGHAGAFGTRRSASASICRRVATPPAGEISTHDFQSHPTPKPLT